MSAAILLSAAALPGTPSLADGDVRVDIGVRSLQGPLWEGMHTQPSVGVYFDYSRPRWPVHLAFALHMSEDEEIRTETEFIPETVQCIPFLICWGETITTETTLARSSLKELSLGVDKVWRSRSLRTRWFLGGGPALLMASIGQFESGVQGRDGSAALWAHAGFTRGDVPEYAAFRFHWGFEVRTLRWSELKIGGLEGDADYLQVSWLGGVDW